MDKFVFVLALGALAVGAFSLTQKDGTEGRLDELARADNDLRDKLTTLEVKIDKLLAQGGPTALLGSAAAPSNAAEDTAEAAVGLATRGPVTALERLAELEKTVERQNETISRLQAEGEAAGKAAKQIGRALSNYYFNADAAAKDLELDERQKADMQDILDRAKGELKDLYAIENDEGVTWAEVRKPKVANVGHDAGFTIAMPDIAKINKFKKSRIPGSSETFGQAEARIKKQAFADVRRTLPPDKAKRWDKARKDPLLGSGGTTLSLASVRLDTDGK